MRGNISNGRIKVTNFSKISHIFLAIVTVPMTLSCGINEFLSRRDKSVKSTQDCSNSDNASCPTPAPLNNQDVIVEPNPTPTAPPENMSLDALRVAAKDIFQKECASCHANGNRAGNFGFVTDLGQMLSNVARFVVAGKPEESLVYQRMTATDPSASMPTSGLLEQGKIDIVRKWITAEGQQSNEVRDHIPIKEVFKQIREDFDRQQDRVNMRYIHFVNLWNAGASNESIQIQRQALSKVLNMLSTRTTITKPLAIDGKELIFRINLVDYDLHLPGGLAQPGKQLERIGRWKEVFENRRPARDTAAQDYYFSALYTVTPPEYKFDSSRPCEVNDTRVYLCDTNLAWMSSVMTLNNPTEADDDQILKDYLSFKGLSESERTRSVTVREVDDQVILPIIDGPAQGKVMLTVLSQTGSANSVTEVLPAVPPVLKTDSTKPHNSKTNPLIYSKEHRPIPLIRGDWFIHQVAANYQQRVYYHLAGIPDDTGVLDIALGIDDEGAIVRDNEADATGKSMAPIIMRAGFTNSGVSQNHRVLERIETQQFTDRALWRSYEFDPVTSSGPGLFNDALNYPFGPILFAQEPGVLGYECVNMFTSPNKLFKSLIDFSPILDWASRYWTQVPINLAQFRPTTISAKADYLLLSEEDKEIYQSFWGAQSVDPLKPMANVKSVPAGMKETDVSDCEGVVSGQNIRERDKAFNFHGFEYQFMRPNGLQGFATVGNNAFISDSKVPNEVALANPDAECSVPPKRTQFQVGKSHLSDPVEGFLIPATRPT